MTVQPSKVETCLQCEAESVRALGPVVTRLEVWSGGQMLYCVACAERWERGDFDSDPDE